MLNSSYQYTVVGLGHIGLPMLLHYSSLGYLISGVDRNENLVAQLNVGLTELAEPGINSDTLKNVEFKTELGVSDVYILCVDIQEVAGHYDIDGVQQLISQIIALKDDAVIVIRSTLDVDALKQIEVQCSSLTNSLIIFSPEFLREGLALEDLQANPVYLGIVHQGKNVAIDQIDFGGQELFDYRALAILKVTNNAWRAAKVSFANLLMMICEGSGANYDDVYKLFIADDLNVSKAYLKGGAPFGGYCLPKETAIMAAYEKKFGSNFFTSVLDINKTTEDYWVHKIAQLKPNRVVFESLSFKSGVNDKRSSPQAIIMNALRELGFPVQVLGDEGIQIEELNKDDLLVLNNPNSTIKAECQTVLIAGI